MQIFTVVEADTMKKTWEMKKKKKNQCFEVETTQPVEDTSFLVMGLPPHAFSERSHLQWGVLWSETS